MMGTITIYIIIVYDFFLLAIGPRCGRFSLAPEAFSAFSLVLPSLVFLQMLAVGLAPALLFLAVRQWVAHSADTLMPMTRLSYFAHSERRLARLSYFLQCGPGVTGGCTGDVMRVVQCGKDELYCVLLTH